jgi:hypothetical protein
VNFHHTAFASSEDAEESAAGDVSFGLRAMEGVGRAVKRVRV